ncbi:hypothetical protein E2562_008721 [Oryza meyeriana var. granulata]|uniref:Uncharacterized protein n=1 Tax=Oryza meyeriana var. granulata TaxID=110450 RepID=A0A6G1F5T3_9ORYZ|nr:hypothetical protein E2562_008721 [Oryza meyeriana var. granulata]
MVANLGVVAAAMVRSQWIQGNQRPCYTTSLRIEHGHLLTEGGGGGSSPRRRRRWHFQKEAAATAVPDGGGV